MAKFEEPPVVPLENTNDVVHRRQLAMRANAAAVSRDGVGRLLYPVTPDEESDGLTPVNYYYPPGDVRRYGIEPTQGSLPDDAGMVVNLYVDPINGDDRNNGSQSAPFATLQRAINAVAAHSAVIRGSWTINLAAGDYSGAQAVRRFITGNNLGLLTIKGPDVGGYPNVPTAVIKQSENTNRTAGLSFAWNQQVILQDIKTEGFSASNRSGIVASRFCDIRLINVHDDGSYYGWRFFNNTTYTADGGLLENNVEDGINELFQVTRAMEGDTVRIVNPGNSGLHAKEFCCGHANALEVDGAGVTGLGLHSWCTINVGGTGLKNCPIGITATNSELHEDDQIVWGTGTDACTRKYNLGPSTTLLSRTGWNGNPDLYRSGSRVPELRGHDYSTTSIADTNNHDIALGTLFANEHALEGQTVRVLVRGKRTVATNDTVTVQLRMGGTAVGTVVLPTASNNAAFQVEFEVLCYADGDFQRVFSYGQIEGAFSEGQTADRTAAWSSSDQAIVVRVVQASGSDQTDVNDVRLYA